MTDAQITALVARLRRAGPFHDSVTAGYAHPDYRDSHEAASALELLRERCAVERDAHEAAEESSDYWHKCNMDNLAKLEAAEARAERLSGLLKRAGKSVQEWCDHDDWMPDEDAELLSEIGAALREPGEGEK